jgi:sugar phosphate isomerase/epimerase
MNHPLPLRLGTSSGIVPRCPIAEDVDVLAASPIACIEVCLPAMREDSPAQLAEALHALRTSRLELWSVHAPFGMAVDLSSLDDAVRLEGLEAVRRAFGLAAELGCQVVVIHASSEPIAAQERAARMAQARHSLASVVGMAQSSGVRAALEPLPRTCLGHTADEMALLLRDLPIEWVGICLDVNHANVGQDIVAFIHRFGARILSLHISDNDGVDEKHWLPGEGVIPWSDVIRALQTGAYSGPFMYEVNLGQSTLKARLCQIGENYRALMAAVSP